MRRREAAPTEVVQPVDVEVYAMSKGADRLRALEVEMNAAFEEWDAAQKFCAEKEVLVEFKMTGPLTAAWAAWRAEKYRVAGGSNGEEETSVIPVPHGWPQQ